MRHDYLLLLLPQACCIIILLFMLTSTPTECASNEDGKRDRVSREDLQLHTGLFYNDPNIIDLEPFTGYSEVSGKDILLKIFDSTQFFSIDDLRKNDVIGTLLMIFYSTSCSHCVRYAPRFKEYSKVLKNQFGSSLRIVAVDCDRFRDTCTHAGVKGTPTIKLYVMPDEERAFDIEEGQVISRVQGILNHAMHIYGRIEKENAANDQNGKDIIDLSVRLGSQSKWRTNKKNRNSEYLLIESLSAENRERIQHDAATAIRFGLETGVFLGRDRLSNDEIKALDDWIFLLSKSFPGEVEKLLLEWLLNEFRSMVSSFSLSSSTWDKLLAKWDFPDSKRYIQNNPDKWWHCKLSTKLNESGTSNGGYACSLWLLFHILTVSNNPQTIDPKQVAVSIHSFVKYFFTCLECRQNFMKQNPDPVKNRFTANGDSSKELIFWLWKEHNSVSARLNREAAQEKDKGKLLLRFQSDMVKSGEHKQFPMIEQCPACYKKSARELNEDKILQFLRCYYNPSYGNHSEHCDVGQFVAWKDNFDVHLSGDVDNLSLENKVNSETATITVLLILCLGVFGSIFFWYFQYKGVFPRNSVTLNEAKTA